MVQKRLASVPGIGIALYAKPELAMRRNRCGQTPRVDACAVGA